MTPKQRIAVFQQNNSGAAKIAAIQKYAEGQITIALVNIDNPLPPIIDDTSDYLPQRIDADLVLSFLSHPDLAYDLALRCKAAGIPCVASGQRFRIEGTLTPPT
jgi:hypothetical protein